MRTTSFFCLLAIAIIMLSSVAMVSCDRRLDDALDMAGGNREELEKGLRHYEDVCDDLKYDAARLLIKTVIPIVH